LGDSQPRSERVGRHQLVEIGPGHVCHRERVKKRWCSNLE
jgi:hypothetical protein